MIKTNGRSDVFVQWFSREFMDRNPDLFRSVTVFPGEALFTIRDGKVGDVVTESTRHVLPGFLGRLKEAVTGKKDIQLLVVDLKSRPVQIALDGYTSDRTRICGAANMMFRISRENIVNVFNMFPRGLKSDTKWDENTLVKEVCEEDVAGYFTYDTKVVVDSFVFSKWDSGRIRDEMPKFITEITDCINTMVPHWSRFGMDVTINSVDMTENAYEEIQKYRTAMSQKQMIDDIDFSCKVHSYANFSNLERERIRAEHAISMEDLAADIELEDTQLSADLSRELEVAQNEVEEVEIRLRADMARARTADEILKMHGVTEQGLVEMRDKHALYMEKERNELEQGNRDRELGRQIDMMKVKMETEYQTKLAEAHAKHTQLLADAMSNLERAKMEGERLGYERGRKDGHDHGYSEGLAEGYRSQTANVIEGVRAISNPQMPYQKPGEAQKREHREGSRFCGSCGEGVPKSARFCTSCGSEL